MCGIAGWYRRNGTPVADAAITAQCDTIRHRGPDDSGVLTDADFGFGMRRLSIVDVPGGHQPMTTPDGRLSIVLNGEIYNHLKLRPRLTAAGYVFASHSDTETALAAFSIWGHEAWAELEGMFAIGVWDRRTRELTLARDPLGIKPLYLTEQMDGIAFASELKALLVLPGHRFDVDDRAVHDFFSFGHVRRPRSIYRQVESLDPGHYLVVGPKGRRPPQAYWRPTFTAAPQRSEGEWVEQMREMLQQTVKDHMMSDVPVGSFLSGGVDSSAVTAAMAMAMASGQPVKAFTIGYPGARIDETAAARNTARHLGCEHIVQTIDLQEAAQVLPTVQLCYDEPFADMAAVPNWYLSKIAAEHVKVVLCGEGGDELLAGYKRHRNARQIERMRPLIDSIGPLATALDRWPKASSTRLNYLRQHAQRFAEFIRLPDGYSQFFAATQISSSRLRRRLYSPAFARAQEDPRSYAELQREYFPGPLPGGGSALEQFLFADLSLNLPSAMLTRLDRASMAHSLEARVPFLSHKFVEFALSAPLDMKLRGDVGKYILREAVRPWIPAATLKRPKQGFQMPLAAWFRGGLGDFARQAWNDSGAAEAGYLDRRAVEALFQEHRRGDADHGRMLYAITMFSCWWENSRSRAVTTGV
jgi:asparagine synthase (glutamine-hydrolysing)